MATSASLETIRTAVRTGGARPVPPPNAPGGVLGLLNMLNPIGTAQAQEIDPDEENRGSLEESSDPMEPIRTARYSQARAALAAVDPLNPALQRLSSPGAAPTEEEITRLQAATRTAEAARADPLRGSPFPSSPPNFEERLGSGAFTEVIRGASSPEISFEPPDKPIEVTGRTKPEEGVSYEQGIRERFEIKKPEWPWEESDLRPDGVKDSDTIEAKYSADFSKSIYNPEVNLPFRHGEVERTLEQAINYLAKSKSLTYYTNSLELAEFCVKTFRAAGLKNFRFVIVPASRKLP